MTALRNITVLGTGVLGSQIAYQTAYRGFDVVAYDIDDAALEAAGIPAAQIKGLDQVIDHPQLAARNRWRTIGTEHAQVDALLPPATFDDFEAPMGDVPALGQHTHALLVEAGLTDDGAASLIARGAALQAPR